MKFKAITNSGEEKDFDNKWLATKWLAGVQEDDFSDFTYPAPSGMVFELPEGVGVVGVGVDGGCVNQTDKSIYISEEYFPKEADAK